jgi:hypothetical protein
MALRGQLGEVQDLRSDGDTGAWAACFGFENAEREVVD